LVAAALQSGDDPKPRPQMTPAVRATVDLARAAAPEIFADTLARLVESGKIPERELQVELLEDAFQAAGSAKEPVQLIALPPTPLGTREIYRSEAGELHLDAISLQARILRILLTIDPAQARKLFEYIEHPALDPRPCEDALVADIAPYYEIAAAIAQSAFTADQKAHDEHLEFLAALLKGARSPNELAAFANVVDAFHSRTRSGSRCFRHSPRSCWQSARIIDPSRFPATRSRLRSPSSTTAS
jgi:hypothetical protein